MASTSIKTPLTPEGTKALALAMDSIRRRELVGGLIRYLKEGETDLGRLLFHFVHVEDYGQAMVEGWGELHGLLTGPPRTIGSLGLRFDQYGEIIQALGSALVDRGHAQERVIDAIKSIEETDWWMEVGGRVLDGFATYLDLEEPEDGDFPTAL